MVVPQPDHAAAGEEFGEDYFARLRAAEDHWWVRGMRDIADVLVGDLGGAPRVLDAGCGSGAMLLWESRLAPRGTVAAVDFSPAAVSASRQLRLPVSLALASVTSLPFDACRFDLMVSMDVLQHLTSEQEGLALEEAVRVLAPGGRLLVRTNSAFGRASVETRDDWRLYRPDDLRAALQCAGLEVERLTPVNALHGLWASLRTRRPATHHRQEERTHGLGIPEPVGPVRNRLLHAVLRMEAQWLRRGRQLPFGHSLYAIARRR